MHLGDIFLHPDWMGGVFYRTGRQQAQIRAWVLSLDFLWVMDRILGRWDGWGRGDGFACCGVLFCFIHFVDVIEALLRVLG